MEIGLELFPYHLELEEVNQTGNFCGKIINRPSKPVVKCEIPAICGELKWVRLG